MNTVINRQVDTVPDFMFLVIKFFYLLKTV